MATAIISDTNRTPFNIGRAIQLHGFQPHEVQPLVEGLVGKVDNPQALAREILDWTGGQPFLTQKLCRLVVENAESIPPSPPDKGGERQESLEPLVRARVIEHWEVQDEPEHLKTIRDRILKNEQRASRLLGLYQQIQILVSASDDGTIKLWNLNGKELHTFHGHGAEVNSVSFSPDGQTLASASADRTVILWNLNLDSLMELGCSWVRDYLRNNPNVSESDRCLCDGIID